MSGTGDPPRSRRAGGAGTTRRQSAPGRGAVGGPARCSAAPAAWHLRRDQSREGSETRPHGAGRHRPRRGSRTPPRRHVAPGPPGRCSCPSSARCAGFRRIERYGTGATENDSIFVVRHLSSADGHSRHARRSVDLDRPERRHGAVDRGVGRHDRVGGAVLVGRHDGARGQDSDPPPRRVRDVDLHRFGRGSLHLGRDGPRVGDGRRGGRLHLHPGRRDPRRGERVLDRAACRRADAELPRLDRPLHGRRPGRIGRRPGSVLAPWQQIPFESLLAEHGLSGLPEREFPTDGWSGARFSMIERGRDRFVIKRTSAATDWIAAATDDHFIREAWLAATWLGSTSDWAYLGAADDGDGAAILLPDLSVELIAWDRPEHQPALPIDSLDRVLHALANLHAVPWPGRLEADAAFPWTPLPERLLLTSRPMCARHIASGIPAGIASAERLLAGWDAFDRHAPRPARGLIEDLAADVTPLIRALSRLPSVGLHGDVKLANVALGPGELVRFIDWSMTIVAPVALELGWLLVSNSGLLPEPPDRVLERYRRATVPRPEHESIQEAGAETRVPGDWDAQVDLAMIVGLLLRGFRKGLDTEAGVTLASGI